MSELVVTCGEPSSCSKDRKGNGSAKTVNLAIVVTMKAMVGGKQTRLHQ